ncbi:MAG: Panacea domain-containing protein [Sphingomicrobium sp.]
MALIASEFTTSTGFDHIKAVQIVAHFLRKAGGKMDKMKLIKLVYLADRTSFGRRSHPMNFDEFFSMQHGPVASSALDGINGKSGCKAWDAVHLVGVTVTIDQAVSTDRLSRNDREILDDVWAMFGNMSTLKLRQWTHDHCSEYEEVFGTRLSITYEEILQAVGAEEADDIARDLRRLQRELGRLPKADAA